MQLPEMEEAESTEKGESCLLLPVSETTNAWKVGERYQETQQNQPGRVYVYYNGFKSITCGSFSVQVLWPLLVLFLFPISVTAILEKQGVVQYPK